MKNILLKLGLVLLSLLLKLRYKVTYKGLNEVQKELSRTSGVLFLPNHPAVIVDPLLVSLPLMKRFGIRPMIIEYMYFQPLFYGIFRAIRAISMPNFSTGFNPIKLKRAERTLKTVSDALKENERFLIYPAGTTKHQGKEIIGGAFGVHHLIGENPNVQIVLVRTTGLWGSSFSRALSAGESPDTKAVLRKGFWTLLKNALFFTPRRHVVIEFELAGQNFPRKSEKQQLNRYLEEWYNRPFGQAGEPLSLVSFAFWKKELPVVKQEVKVSQDLSQVPEEVQRRVAEKIAELAKMPVRNILPDLKLVENLGLDSLDIAQAVAFLEERYHVSAITPQELTTVSSLYLAASGRLVKRELPEKKFDMKGWNKNLPHERLKLAEGTTLVESFLRASDQKLFEIVAADPILGPQSYYSIKKKVLILQEKIKTLKGERIGILLPASIMSQVLMLACQMAGKSPVMINWTVGGRHLDAVVEVSKIEVVLSSWAFLDQLANVDISRIEPMLLVLEELKVGITFRDLVKGSINAFRSAKSLYRPIDPESEAVVLFTSGTESMPKGVPLTHTNILFDLTAALKRVELFRDDKLLAMLPPFHSFGFSVTGILPLLSNLRVIYYPNPTDSKKLAGAIHHWQVTILCSAPTFLKNILLTSPKKNLQSVRMAISGAEKSTSELLSLFHKSCQHALFVEGYGITECAPIISANVSGDSKNGVGQALDGIELAITDPENLTIQKPVGEVGLILASGPNIFSGYLNKVAHDPFVEFGDRRWYQTGDLGSLDKQGNLRIAGRLKRFVKFGGEMISLGALEEALSRTGSEKPSCVIVAEDDPTGKARLVLIATYDCDTNSANQILRKSGFSNLAKIDRVVVLNEIPQTATGKIAYRELDKLLQEGKAAR